MTKWKQGLFLVFGMAMATWAKAQFSIQEMYSPEVITNSFGETMPMRVWRHYKPEDRPVPVVLLLHGSGQSGKDNLKQLETFTAFHNSVLIDDTLPPALYVIPQCTAANPWVRTIAFKEDFRQPRYPAPALRTVKEYLDALIKEGTADPERLYIAGFSLGGFGTWDAIQRWPNFFAAAIPICGGGSVEELPIRNAATTSIWAFHGGADGTVPPACSRRMIAALTQVGVSPKYTEYPNAGHVIWQRALGDSAVIRWMFRQRRGHVESSDQTLGGFFRQLKEYVTPK